MTITMTPVEGSSNIAAHGYDRETQTARVKFVSGRLYEASGIPPEVYARFAAEQESHGQHFHRHLAEYGFKPVEGEVG